jgi:hypothetical protein
MRRLIPVFSLALLVAACSGGPPPEPPGPPPLDPVGVYDCALFAEGMEFGATLTITEEEGGYTGSVDSDMGPAPVSDIVVEGDEMTFVVDTPEMVVFFVVVFDGDTFTGEFDTGGMYGSITGTKR